MDSTSTHTGSILPRNTSVTRSSSISDASSDRLRQDSGKQLKLMAVEHATNELMEQIYRDIHEMSANDLLENASEPPKMHGSDPIEISIRTALFLRMKEMQQVIDGALLYRQCLAPCGGGDESHIDAVDSAVHGLRGGGPDPLRRTESLFSSIQLQRSRWSLLARKQGWMMLSILANSLAFRTASSELDNRKWAALVNDVNSNARSLEIFAKLRGLDWKRALDLSPFNDPPLTEDEVQSRSSVDPHHPHEWFLSLSGDPKPCKFQGQRQINITECIYSEVVFGYTGKRPSQWPRQWAWPADPMVFRPGYGYFCQMCGSKKKVCYCHENLFVNPLVELIEYPSKGLGVRALQRIDKGSYLSEYVGRYIPPDGEDPEDPQAVYHLEAGMSTLTVPKRRFVMGRISAAVVGSWTRFINHSCEPSTDFHRVCVGGRHRLGIQAVRQIEMYEEITIDYGDVYWTEGRLCRCGAGSCKWSTPEDVRHSMREARRMFLP